MGARRGTWGKLARLNVHCSVEYCLDDCLRKMRKQVLINAQKDIEQEVVEDIETTVTVQPVPNDKPPLDAASASVGDKQQQKKPFRLPYKSTRSKSTTGIPVSNSEQDLFRRLENRDSFLRKSLSLAFSETDTESEDIPPLGTASFKGSEKSSKVHETKNWLSKATKEIGSDESFVSQELKSKDLGRPSSESSTQIV